MIDTSMLAAGSLIALVAGQTSRPSSDMRHHSLCSTPSLTLWLDTLLECT